MFPPSSSRSAVQLSAAVITPTALMELLSGRVKALKNPLHAVGSAPNGPTDTDHDELVTITAVSSFRQELIETEKQFLETFNIRLICETARMSSCR